MNTKSIKTLEDAINRINELETECEYLRSRIKDLEGLQPAGRKPHNEKWQADYAVFVNHYENGEEEYGIDNRKFIPLPKLDNTLSLG